MQPTPRWCKGDLGLKMLVENQSRGWEFEYIPEIDEDSLFLFSDEAIFGGVLKCSYCVVLSRVA